MRNTERITVYDVVALATDDGEWVDGEFLAVVRNATARQGKKPSKADLCDPDSPNIKVKAAAFGPSVDFTELLGTTCLFSGKGMKVKTYNGVAELSLSDKSTVQVESAARPHTPKSPEEITTNFHRTMKKTALLWMHSFQYVQEIESKLKVMLPADLRQSAISSMFITAKDQGLLAAVPAPRALDEKGVPVAFVAPKAAEPDPEEARRKAEAAAEEARKRHEAEETARRAALDEDVPF